MWPVIGWRPVSGVLCFSGPDSKSPPTLMRESTEENERMEGQWKGHDAGCVSMLLTIWLKHLKNMLILMRAHVSFRF